MFVNKISQDVVATCERQRIFNENFSEAAGLMLIHLAVEYEELSFIYIL